MTAPEDLRECPVCTFGNAFPDVLANARCPICGWINDVAQRSNSDLAEGANGPMTLTQAREARQSGWNVDVWRMDHFFGHKKPNVKVRFKLDRIDDWPPYETEGLWAEQLTEDTFRLDNIPLYAEGVSCADVVRATPEEGGVLIVQSIVEHGGHSTYRLMLTGEFPYDSEVTRSFFRILNRLGCTYEGQDATLYGLDVPPEANVRQVEQQLSIAEATMVWTYERTSY